MLLIGVWWIYNVHTTILCEDTAICEIGYCTGRCSDGDCEGAINVLYGSLCVDALNPGSREKEQVFKTLNFFEKA